MTRPVTDDSCRASRRLHRLLGRYRFPGPFSVELSSAIMRQGSFIDKMSAMGWTSPERFESKKDVLLRAIARYHAFLDLMAAVPALFLVPTLVCSDATLCANVKLTQLGYRSHMTHSPTQSPTVSRGYSETARYDTRSRRQCRGHGSWRFAGDHRSSLAGVSLSQSLYSNADRKRHSKDSVFHTPSAAAS